MDLEKLKGLGDEEVMQAYIKEAETVSFEGNFGEAYDKEWALKDEGKREGIELGKREGIELGKREGIELGKKTEKQEIAKNMLKEKMKLSIITKVTGLTEEELTALEEE